MAQRLSAVMSAWGSRTLNKTTYPSWVGMYATLWESLRKARAFWPFFSLNQPTPYPGKPMPLVRQEIFSSGSSGPRRAQYPA